MTMKKIILALCLLLLVFPVYAKNNKHGHGNGQQLPPGLQKKVERGGELPPGWQKKVAKGKVVEDSIYIHMEAPPRDVLRALPPPPPGVIIKQIEDKIVELREKDRFVLDIFDADNLPPPPPPPPFLFKR